MCPQGLAHWGLYISLPLSEFLNFQAITLEKEYILKIENCKLEKTKTDKHLHVS